MAIHIQTDRKLASAEEPSIRRALVRIVAPAVKTAGEARAPLNLALVLDRSQSMGGNKIQLAREGAIRAVRSLRDTDHVAAVAYDDRIELVLASQPATAGARAAAERAISAIDSRGWTNLCEGWLRGCEQIGLTLSEDAIGRCLLLTDGLANKGVTDPATILKHARELRARGVTTSTLGVGTDFDETLLRQMAEAGGGNFYYVENEAQLADLLAGEVGEALQVVARGVRLEIEVPPGVRVQVPDSLQVELSGEVFTASLGSLVANQVLDLLLRVELPAVAEGAEVLLTLRLRDADGVFADDAWVLTWRGAATGEAAAEAPNPEVMRAALEVEAAEARQTAAAQQRVGQGREAKETLMGAAAAVLAQAGGDEELLNFGAALEKEALRIEEMEAHEVKRLSYESYKRRTWKGLDGFTMKARRHHGLQREYDYGDGPIPHVGPAAFAAVVHPRQLALEGVVREAIAALGRVRIPQTAYTVNTSYPDPLFDSVRNPIEELGIVCEIFNPAAPLQIALVTEPFRDNWFAHYHAPERIAIVSLHGWEEISSVPVVAYVAYMLVMQSVRQRVPGFDVYNLLHTETRGCWGDFCQYRPELELKLQLGQLCDECQAGFRAVGFDPQELMPLIDVVTELAHGRTGQQTRATAR